MTTMQAIYLARKDAPAKAFDIKESEAPRPSSKQFRIKTEYSGLNFAEVLARQGLYPDAPKLPFIPGYDVVGTIDEVGSEVSDFKVGDRIVAGVKFGGYASHVIIDPYWAAKLPQGYDGAKATALPCQYGTALYAANYATRLLKGDIVLIHAAAGGVGTALVQLCKQQGCTVIGTVGSAEKKAVLEKLGVDHIINYRDQDFSVEVKKILGKSRRVDVVFDSIGGLTFRKSFSLLGSGGRIVNYGIANMSSEKASKFTQFKGFLDNGFYNPLVLLAKSKGIIGLNMFNITQRRPAVCSQLMIDLVQMIQEKKIDPIVGKVFDYKDVAAAQEYLGSRKSVGKIVLKW